MLASPPDSWATDWNKAPALPACCSRTISGWVGVVIIAVLPLLGGCRSSQQGVSGVRHPCVICQRAAFWHCSPRQLIGHCLVAHQPPGRCLQCGSPHLFRIQRVQQFSQCLCRIVSGNFVLPIDFIVWHSVHLLPVSPAWMLCAGRAGLSRH